MLERIRGFVPCCLALSIMAAGWGCSSDSKEQNRAPRAVPVVVGAVTQKDVPLQQRVIGNVQPFATVSVRSLVAGEIMAVHFVEGQPVGRGDLLFAIDPRSFEAALRQAEAALARSQAQVRQAEANLARDLSQVKQAEANVERDSAQARNARVQAERYKTLAEKHLVAQEQYDQVRTTAESMEAVLLADRAAVENANATARASREAVENAKAAVQADRAAVDNARIQLGYCTIRSPVGGRTGSVFVHRGNIIRANDTQPLTVVNQISPVYVDFRLPEKVLPEIRKYMAHEKLRVDARIPNDEGPEEQGVLTFVDNAVDSTTGTIHLKGTFENKSERLWPGQFVNVVLTLARQPNAIVVPSKAIQTGQQGQYVFVVKSDSTAESRPITVDRSINGETVVAKGLAAGETVVTDGQLQLVPGTKVVIKKPEPAGTRGRKPA